MRMYLISDNIDSYTGLRLAGIEGEVVHTKGELSESLQRVLADESIGIVLLTEKFGKDFPELVNSYKQSDKHKLFVDIPDRHGSGRSPNFITDYVNQAIGLKL